VFSGLKIVRVLCIALALTAGVSAKAQNLPGIAINDDAVSQSARTLANLAIQVYPDLFSQPTTWREFDGFHYRYFGSSGVYLGIKDQDLYLLGGPFGDNPAYQGTIADAIVFVQSEAGTASSAAFQDFITAKTSKELLSYFKKITMEYGSSLTLGSNPFAKTDAVITMEALGQDTFQGATTDRVKITLTGSPGSAPSVYDLWIDTQGVVVRLILNGDFEYNSASAKAIGPGLMSAMQLSLAAIETSTVRSVIANATANSSVVTSNTTNTTIGGNPVQSMALVVSSSVDNAVELTLSDFGPFTMATKYSASLNGGFQKSTSYFRIVDVVLK
tara:strand:+ start:10993 stop:11982 length:990 start_codon:yes stop_codon:yes gene_type:complete